MKKARLIDVKFPNIGLPAEPRPELPPSVFRRRLAVVRKRMTERGLEALVVYGDREHFANVHYLTNYDPRFEETLLVVLPTGRPVLFVGNEGWGYATIARLDVDKRLYQTLSLLGQPREQVKPLRALLAQTGLKGCRRVGTVGWKSFTPSEFEDPEHTLELPSFMVTAIRETMKPDGEITNETAMFMEPETGLRSVNEVEQLADFEWVAACNSQALLDGLRALRVGQTEQEAFAGMRARGLALGCHPVCSAAERLRLYGMASPTTDRIRRGDPLFMTMAYQGSNCCRFGWVARGARELPATARDYVEKVAAPYAMALATWYETLRVGATGNELHHAVDGLRQAGFTLGLNAGHQIAYDEWTHSPVAEGGQQRAPSSSYWQSDFFATLPGAYLGAFAEDGAAVADGRLRAKLKQRYPAMWSRIAQRQRFMREVLGIGISDDVLPFSNFPAAVTPFLLTPDRCMVMAP